jgi:hypothetical protein
MDNEGGKGVKVPPFGGEVQKAFKETKTVTQQESAEEAQALQDLNAAARVDVALDREAYLRRAKAAGQKISPGEEKPGDSE